MNGLGSMYTQSTEGLAVGVAVEGCDDGASDTEGASDIEGASDTDGPCDG